MKNWITLSLAAVLAVGLAGCTQEARQKYDAAGEKLEQGVEKTGEAVATDAKETGEAVQQGVENAGEAIEDAAADTKQAADNSLMTGKVKNAILTANDLEAKDLNVDTVDKKIVLRGSVPTEEQKKRAEQIAKTQAGNDYTVDNQLTVSRS